jgi:hypothetical protein
MRFNIKSKQNLDPQQGFITLVGTKCPEVGDIRMIPKFAWIPVKVFFDPDDVKYTKRIKQYVWLEKYFRKEKFSIEYEIINPNPSLSHLYDNRRMVECPRWKHVNNWTLKRFKTYQKCT